MGGKRGFDGLGRLRADDEICFKMYDVAYAANMF
jgi:hypothetical protein